MASAKLRRSQKLSPTARALLLAFLLLLVGLSVHRLGQQRESHERATATATANPQASAVIAFDGPTMGTRYAVKVVARGAQGQRLQRAALQQVTRRALEEVEASMSTYLRESELSRWNDAETTEPVKISEHLRRVMEVALEVGRASGEALDVTLGPLVDAWGFGPADAGAAPGDAQLAILRQQVGLSKLKLSAAGLAKLDPDVRVDLSAVAKGYAVDLIGERLEAAGARDFFLEVGGEVLARGVRADGTPWRAGIEKPLAQAHALPQPPQIQRVLPLRDQALATSGDYRNFRERDGERLPHFIDPRTGRPAMHAPASVSVVHQRAALADAWATALAVLGPDAGYDVAVRENLLAYFVVRDPAGGFRTKLTPRFAAEFPPPK